VPSKGQIALDGNTFGRNMFNSAAAAAPTVTPNALTRQLVQRSALWTYQMIIPAGKSGVPQLVPGLYVPRNCSVWVYAKNGTLAGNSQPIYVADRSNALIGAPNSQSTVLMPGDSLPYSVDNTGQIWVAGVPTDGLLIQMLNNPAS
jgi:hypothetical protein